MGIIYLIESITVKLQAATIIITYIIMLLYIIRAGV